MPLCKERLNCQKFNINNAGCHNPKGYFCYVAAEATKTSPLGSSETAGYAPAEILDLCRFLAKTWAEIDKFVYENCTGDALMRYPVIQGTRNQLNLKKIGEQPINAANTAKAVKFMLSA